MATNRSLIYDPIQCKTRIMAVQWLSNIGKFPLYLHVLRDFFNRDVYSSFHFFSFFLNEFIDKFHSWPTDSKWNNIIIREYVKYCD